MRSSPAVAQRSGDGQPRSAVALFRPGERVRNFVQKNLLDGVFAVGQAELSGYGDVLAPVVALAKTSLGVVKPKTPRVQVVFAEQS